MQTLHGYLLSFSSICYALWISWLSSLSQSGLLVQAQTVASENTSLPKDPAMQFPYFIAGTAFPCSSLEKCTFVINGSDPLGNTINTEVEHERERKQQPCIIQGHLDISQNWYGYLAKKIRLHPETGKFYYKFRYAQEKCCIKILLYLEEQVERLRAHMSCIQKQSVIDPLSPQVISLSPSSPTSGCIHNATSPGAQGSSGVIDCRSGRILRSDIERDWYIAAASCGSPTGLDVQYSLMIYGLIGECPSSLTVNQAAPHYHSTIPSIILICLLFSLRDHSIIHTL